MSRNFLLDLILLDLESLLECYGLDTIEELETAIQCKKISELDEKHATDLIRTFRKISERQEVQDV